jgi:hypothetical protein
MTTPGTPSEPRPPKQDDVTGSHEGRDPLVGLRVRVSKAIAEIQRLRSENAELRARLDARQEGGPGAALGLPDDPAERRAMLDELIRTVDFYITRDS